MKIRNFLCEANWCQGFLAKDAAGNHVIPWNEKACKWCLQGAILKCYRPSELATQGSPQTEEEQIIRGKVLEYIKGKGYAAISYFNDRNKWEDVKALIEELDI